MMPNPQLIPILADLKRMAAGMDLTHDNLASDLMDIAVEEMQSNIESGLDCNDQPFAQLSELYQISKGRHFPGRPIARLYGLMTGDAEMKGVRDITPHRAVMTYGITQDARDEAVWFQDPSTANQPQREFYGLTARAIQRCDDRIDKAFS